MSSTVLNFGVSTLEEIRLRKALKASMKRAGYPVQSADGAPLKSHRANRENIHSHLPPGVQVSWQLPLTDNASSMGEIPKCKKHAILEDDYGLDNNEKHTNNAFNKSCIRQIE